MTETPTPRNIANELAKERNREAAERTLMAWIRTALSLIGFGFRHRQARRLHGRGGPAYSVRCAA